LNDILLYSLCIILHIGNTTGIKKKLYKGVMIVMVAMVVDVVQVAHVPEVVPEYEIATNYYLQRYNRRK
jgi:hypothetical protein